MITDYSNTYSPAFGNAKKRTRQKISGKSTLSSARLMLKAIGFMVGITVMVGVCSTFWYGWQINIALDDIGKNQVVRQELVAQNRQIISQRDNQTSRENIITRAGKLGLYPPVKGQVRKP